MPEFTEEQTEALEKWIADWQQEFATDYKRDEIDSWIGKKVKLTRDGDESEYEFIVVGSAETFVWNNAKEFAVQLAIVTLDGKMIQLRPGVSVEVVEDG